MKCAGCAKTVTQKDHEDVLDALGKIPVRDFRLMEKALSLSSQHAPDALDASGNPVTCGACYTKAFTHRDQR